MIKYRIRTDDGDWSKSLDYWPAINEYHKRLDGAGTPYQTKRPDDEKWSNNKSLKRVMENVRKALPKFGIGDFWRTRGAGGRVFFIQKIQVGLPERTPAFDISSGQAGIQKLARVAAGFDPTVRCAGIAYTRKIAGTSLWSQHSRWPRLSCHGNAIDFYFPLPPPRGNDLLRQRRLVSYILAHANELNLNMIISERTYWSRENGFSPRYYSGIAHVSHTHMEIYPPQTGSPCSY